MNNRSVKTTLLICAILCLAGQKTGAQYVNTVLDIEKGLPCNYVDDVLQDSYGFVWVATAGGGLTRYDGQDAIVFNTLSEVPLRNNFVKDLVEDRFGRLWIGSEGGVDILDLTSLNHAKLDLSALGGLESSPSNYISADERGNMWLKLGDTLLHLCFDEGGGISSVSSLNDRRIPRGNFIFKDIDGDGSIWAVMEGKLHKIEQDSGGRLRVTPLQTDLSIVPGAYISGFLLDGGMIWISCSEGIYALHRQSGKWRHYTHIPGKANSLTQNFVTDITKNIFGELVFSTLYGCNIYNPVSDDFRRIGSASVNCIKTFGNKLYIGTESAGLLILTPKPINSVEYELGGPVNALWEDSSGNIWTGVQEGGLHIYTASGVQKAHITAEKGGLSHNSVSDICPGEDDIIYIGTWGGGIVAMQEGTPYRIKYRLPVHGDATAFIGAMEWDALNRLLWVGTNVGIYLYDPEKRSYSPACNGDNLTGCIGSCLDSKGRLWIGGQEGVFVFNTRKRNADGTFPFRHFRYRLDAPELCQKDKICDIIEASDSTIWIASNGSGIFRAVENGDGALHFKSFSKGGAARDRSRAMAEGPDGEIWTSTEYGLNVVNPGSGAIYTYGRESGLEHPNFFWNSALSASDGTLYFGSTVGLTVVKPADRHRFDENPEIRFSGIHISDRTSWTPDESEISASQTDRSIRLSFCVPGAVPSSIRYAYMLEGYDKQWQYLPDESHQARYSSLPPGKFTLQVRALDASGSAIAQKAAVIKVKPLFYNTVWFRILVIMLLIAGVYAVTQLRTRAISRRNKNLEKKVEERTREIKQQAEELSKQNTLLLHQNEELASRKILLSPEVAGKPNEENFIQKVLDVLKEHYKNPEFDVSAFSTALGMSKTLLNTRLHLAVGQSPGQFIRTYRLTVAREILENSKDMNVSEIAYEVGFNDPKYFTRCFTKEFNMSPSAMQKVNKSSQDRN